ncbi:MAG: aldo/keto reductase [Bacteroidales bacterium]|nr:aldo/keto reductase [Bacteroidales bacterium]MCM1146226.1 aldo/keto reductase [Bacteroidales bacterium]MCM1205336.1 aldo/keto reductase [Bacillota bacterium]MCM1509577.1 aldo/keto reductase [Clostridium sp.]
METPKLMIGTFQNKNYKSLLDVVRVSVENGFFGFDTAPSYGTELYLGRAIRECCNAMNLKRENFFLSDKVDAWQMYKSDGEIRPYVENALKKIDTEYIDLLYIHWPIDKYLDKTWRCFMELVSEGIVKNVGICNVRVRHLKQWESRGINPNYVQIERHPLRTCSAELDYCAQHKIKVFAYSPLCRMHPMIKDSSYLESLSEKYKKKVAQIILRWHIDSGVIPVFMSTKPSRIKENIDIFDFSLTDEEINVISSMNQNYKIFLESWGCPGF